MRKFNIEDKTWSVFVASLVAAILVAAGCGQQTKKKPESVDEFEQKMEEKLGYELEQYERGRIAPDEPRLRPGIDVIKMPAKYAADVEVRANEKVAIVREAGADRLDDKQADAGDLLMGPNFNYRIADIEDRGDHKRLELETYIIQDIIWGHFKVEKTVPLSKKYLEKGGPDDTPTLRLPADQLYNNDNDRVSLEPVPPKKRIAPDDAQVPEPVGPVREGKRALNTDQNVLRLGWGYDYANLETELLQDSAISGSASVTGSVGVRVALNYDTEIVFEGRIYAQASGIANFDYKDNYDSNWCDNHNFSGDVWVAEGGICVQKFGFKFGLSPSVTVYDEIVASAGFSYSYYPGPFEEGGIEQLEFNIPLASTPVAFKPNFLMNLLVSFGLNGSLTFGVDATADMGDIIIGFECDRQAGNCTIFPQDMPDTEYSAGSYAEAAASASVVPKVGAGFRMDVGLSGVDWVDVESPALWLWLYLRAKWELGYDIQSGELGSGNCILADAGLFAEFRGQVTLNLDPPVIGPWEVPLTGNGPMELARVQFWPEVTWPRQERVFEELYCVSEDQTSAGEDPEDVQREPGAHPSEEAFKIEALWDDTETDIDLTVNTADGENLEPGDDPDDSEWSHPFDVCEGGSCDLQSEYGEAAIYTPADEAPDGNYGMTVENNGNRTADVTLNVRRADRVIESWEFTLSPGRSEDRSGNYTPESPTQ
jgi:hypothetical protein